MEKVRFMLNKVGVWLCGRLLRSDRAIMEAIDDWHAGHQRWGVVMYIK